jgi:hypothetical protein
VGKFCISNCFEKNIYIWKIEKYFAKWLLKTKVFGHKKVPAWYRGDNETREKVS